MASKKVLSISINGGGALGIGPLTFMTRLEQDIGKSLSKTSVAFSGTSTGAIIAACFNEGMSAHDIFDLYKNNLKKIFTKTPYYKRILPKQPKYDNKNLISLLKSNLSGKIDEWDKPIFITTTRMNSISVEKVWDTNDKNVDKWFAVLTSVSAPTYFDVIEKDGFSYCDGGMWANDPIAVLQSGLQNTKYKNKTKILSFDTGMTKINTSKGNKTLIGWASYILNDWIARTGLSNYHFVTSNIGKENVFRCSPVVGKEYDMDDISEETVQTVIKIWTEYYESVREDLLKWLKE